MSNPQTSPSYNPAQYHQALKLECLRLAINDKIQGGDWAVEDIVKRAKRYFQALTEEKWDSRSQEGSSSVGS